MQIKDVTPIIAELVRLKNSIPLKVDVGRYLPEVRKNTHGEAVRSGLKKALRVIEQAPTIEAEPVRHGRWARKEKNHVYWHECSECGERPLKSNGYYCQSTFCPNCGAKMDGESG